MTYHSYRWWIRWFVPFPILVKIAKRQFGRSFVFYQDDEVQVSLQPYRKLERCKHGVWSGDYCYLCHTKCYYCGAEDSIQGPTCRECGHP